MSEKQESAPPTSTTKKFGKGEREVPHHSQKAKKWYPAEDESKPKKVMLTTPFEYALLSKNMWGLLYLILPMLKAELGINHLQI